MGEIFILQDISKEAAALRTLLYALLLITAAIGGVLFVGFFLFTGSIERRLLQDNETLRQEKDAHAQTAWELEEHRHHLEELVAEKTSALEENNRVLQKEIIDRRGAEKRWERTFDAMGDIVTIHDAEMRIVRANRATKKILGIDWQELLGRHCYEVFRGENTPCAGCPEALAQHDFKLHTTEIEHPNLKKSFLVTAAPLIDEQGHFEGVIHVAKDITEQKLLAAQLRQAQKMEAVGTLAGGVAHDFNNLLTGILGYAELALMETPADSPLYRDLSEVLALGRRGASLIRQLLAFSRQQAMEAVDLDLNNLITNLMKLLHRLIPENIELEFAPGPDLWRLKADEGQLEQVVVNLAVNARDAMPEGGRLVIDTANVEPDGDGEKPLAALVRLRVSDTGTGMDEATREQIFEPFFTTKEVGKGTGLGLSLVYGIVKQHGGFIAVHSQMGAGTTFTVYLPVLTSDPVPMRKVKTEGVTAGGSETILLVEGNPALRQSVADALVELGYQVLSAANGVEALEIFANQDSAIDLVLTDLVMPGLGGGELAKMLRHQRPDIKILIMTGHPLNENKSLLRELEEIEWLQKPFEVEDLADRLRAVLDGSDG